MVARARLPSPSKLFLLCSICGLLFFVLQSLKPGYVDNVIKRKSDRSLKFEYSEEQEHKDKGRDKFF